MNGEIAFGQRLVESQLAEKLQVSRTPIREAIRRLQQEQLLTDDTPDGIKIVQVSLSSAVHIYDCRIALEQMAVTEACRLATAEQLQQVRQTLLEADRLSKVSEDSSAGLKRLDLNYDYHRLIAEMSQNPWLISLLDQLAAQVKLLRLQTLQTPVDIAEIQAEHWQIYAAIAQRNAEAASAHIRRHLEASQTRIIHIFNSQDSGSQLAIAASPFLVTCPQCKSQDIKKNGRRGGKQLYRCKACGRQFIDSHGS